MPEKRDYYEVLGVTKGATADEIKRAYRKAAAANHPDRNPGDQTAVDRFKEAAEAYDVLSSDDKRQLYDRMGHEAFARGGGGRGPTAGFNDLEEIFGAFGGMFGDIFGGGRSSGGRSGPRPTQGDSLRINLSLELKDIAFGVTKPLEFTRDELCETCDGSGAKAGTSPVKCDYCGGRGQVVQQQAFFRIQTPCPTCRGSGQSIKEKCTSCRGSGRQPKRVNLDVRVPAGVEDGMILRLRGEGEPGEHGGPRGDIECVLQVKDHPLFERDGSDLHCTVPISFPAAVLGTTFDIPLLEGQHSLEVPPGTQPGDTLRIRAKGLPHFQTQRKGDLLVTVQVEVPKKLTDRQEQLIRELADIDHLNVNTRHKSWLEKIKDLFVASDPPEEQK